MHSKRSRSMLAEFWLAWMLLLGALAAGAFALPARAQAAAAISTTQITDTVYRADGTPATGTVLISWPAFATWAGDSVPAGSTSITIGTNGALSVQLAANAGSTPMGSYYTVVYHLDDGSVTREYWVVPVSSAPVAVSSIRSSVLPASVAMQTVSKSYVDTAIAAAVTGHPLDSSTQPYVLKSGDSMSGPLALAGDPTAPLQAADKNYVDTQAAALQSGLNQKVSLLPQGTQTVTQPAGTSLEVNTLDGVQNAAQFTSGAGNNGISNAAASPNCSAACEINVEPTYAGTDLASASTLNDQTIVTDARGGAVHETFVNPLPPGGYGLNAARTIDVTSTRPAPQAAALGQSEELFSSGLVINSNALSGGNNVYPKELQGTVPYFKTTYSGLQITGTNNTTGQHVLFGEQQNCYGVGDCLMGGMFMQASGGFRDDADEGSHPFDRSFSEDTRVFTGSCAGGCSTGSTSLKVTPQNAGGTQGDGRYLIDTNPALAITAGAILGQGPLLGRQPSAVFTGTSFPVSTFLESAQSIPTQSNNIAPGTVTVAIATSSLPTGFAGNTAALPSSSGVACISDVQLADQRPLNFETAAYTIVDGSHLQLTLNRPHASGATIAVGGLCGYGLEQKVDTVGAIRQVFPVIGSDSPTSLLYAGGYTPIIGQQGQTSAFVNANLVIASIARAGGVTTVTTTSNFQQDLNGLTLNIANVTDPSYNGSFVVTTTGPNTLTYANAGPDSASAGGSVSLLTGAYGLYPMAEVLSVYNPVTKAVDGQMTLAANTVPWSAGDPVEQPHYFQEWVSADTDFITQYTPRALHLQSAGIIYDGNNSAGLIGWRIQNSVAATSYFGNGGTHTAPNIGMEVLGTWNHSFETQAGETTVFDVHCNSHGCNRWNSTYDLFDLDSSAGVDNLRYAPSTSTLTMGMRGNSFVFSPQSFTTPSITTGSLNANSINGHFIGTIGAQSLPVFGGSGTAHQVGAVPDPGATPGTTRFLREDGNWVTVAAGTGGGTGSGSGGGSFTLPAASSLLAEYLMTEGTGTTVHDASGLGNDATLGAGSQSPTWTPTGLSFSYAQNVNLPVALNAVQTIVAAVQIRPLTTNANHQGGNSLLISNTVGNTDLQVLMEAPYPGTPNALVDSAYGLDLFAAGSVTASSYATSGFHTLAITLGTCGQTNDRLFLDGQELAYTVQGCSAGKQTAGNLLLGPNPAVWGGSGIFPGQVYAAAFYSTALTPDQVTAASGILRNAVAARGVAVETLPTPLSTPALNVAGDSITMGYPNLTPYSQLLSLENPPTTGVNNWGISGITLQALLGSEDNRVGPLCRSAAGPAVYTLFGGTNDFNSLGSTPPAVFAALTGLIGKMKNAGCRVGVVTMLSRAGNSAGNNGGLYDSAKNAYNTLIRNGARAAGADFLVDAAASPSLGADGAYSNQTWFQADGTHPTQAGQQLIANIYSNAYNYAFGHNKANPNQVADSTYQMLSSDGAVSLTGTGAQALTLPDCTGPSGASYVLNNSTGVAKTVVGQSGQPINGLASAITIAPNSSLTLFDVPNPGAVSGCHWEY